MRFKEARDIRQSTLELNQLAEDVRRKAATAHTHVASDVSGLVAALAGKASVDHAHPDDEALGYFLQP